MRLIVYLLAAFALATAPAAISPSSVVVVANAEDPDSLEIARYYMDQRGIPGDNLIALPMPRQEAVSGEIFLKEIFNPLRETLVERDWIQGTLGRGYDPVGRRELAARAHRIGFLVLCRIPYQVDAYPEAAERAFAQRPPENLASSQASVDAELALLLSPPVPVVGPLNNPLFRQLAPPADVLGQVIRVARLDGPSVDAVKRLVDSAREGEARGLRGRAYVDYGGPHPQGEQWLEQTEAILKRLDFPLSVDHEKARFGWTDRLDAPALYFGWWCHQPEGAFESPRYRFPPGAIALHISSFSGQHLRQPSKRWSGSLVERGIAATVGNVYEPYLQLTHVPPLWLEGMQAGLTTGEAAYYALPALSWMAMFIGDPLYQPFRTDLDAQLAALSPDDSLAQYVVLRESQRLARTEGEDAAFNYLKQHVHRAPGLAISYAVAQGWEARGERAQAVEALAFAARLTEFAPEDCGLAYQIAESLIAWQARESGYAILKTLASQAHFTAEKDAYLQAAIPLARQFGDRELADQWQAEIDAIIRQREEAAARRKAAREAKKKQP